MEPQWCRFWEGNANAKLLAKGSDQCFFYWRYSKYCQMVIFFFKNANFGDFFQKLIFLSPKFSSNMTISHPI
jgi:hypothetical protein